MHGVLHVGSTKQYADDQNGNDGNFYLSSSQYLWKSELLRGLSNQLQGRKKNVGLMDDMGRAACAYPSRVGNKYKLYS